MPSFNELEKAQIALNNAYKPAVLEEFSKMHSQLTKGLSPATFKAFAELQAQLTKGFEPTIFEKLGRARSAMIENLSLPTSLMQVNVPLYQFNMKYHEALMSSINQLQPLFASCKIPSKDYLTAINNTFTITKSLDNFMHSINWDSLLSSLQEGNTNPNDYITTDSPMIRTFDISENFVIPIGSNRIRIKTSDFIALIALIFSIFAYLFPRPENRPSAELPPQNVSYYIEVHNPSQEDIVLQEQNQHLQEQNLLLQEQNQQYQEQNLLLQEQNQQYQEQNLLLQEQNQHLQEQNQLSHEQEQLLQEQNRFLLDIFKSVDASSSSQAEFFKEILELLQK